MFTALSFLSPIPFSHFKFALLQTFRARLSHSGSLLSLFVAFTLSPPDLTRSLSHFVFPLPTASCSS